MKNLLLMLTITLFISGCSFGNTRELELEIQALKQDSVSLNSPYIDLSKSEQCKVLAKREVDEEKERWDDDSYDFIEIDAFWSDSLQTCIMTEVSTLDLDYGIKDLKGNFMKGDYKWLFSCDEHGVTNTVLDAIKEHNGYIDNVNFDLYMIDANGGSVRNRPENKPPTTRQECETAFNKKISNIQ